MIDKNKERRRKLLFLFTIKFENTKSRRMSYSMLEVK